MEENLIRGWAELQPLTGKKYEALRRAIALEGFPPPRKLRERSKLTNVWCKLEVLSWLMKTK